MKPKFSKNKVTQTINLEKSFGISFKGLPSLREALGGAIIERIRKRTSQGKSITGGNLKAPYSKAYTKSDDFKAFGKSKSPINMKLSGDMLGLMDVVKQTQDTITIGWKDRDENNKAFNHNTGDTVPKRPFFGVTKKEVKDIKKEFKKDIAEAIKTKETKGRKEFESKVLDLVKAFKVIGPEVDDG